MLITDRSEFLPTVFFMFILPIYVGFFAFFAALFWVDLLFFHSFFFSSSPPSNSISWKFIHSVSNLLSGYTRHFNMHTYPELKLNNSCILFLSNRRMLEDFAPSCQLKLLFFCFNSLLKSSFQDTIVLYSLYRQCSFRFTHVYHFLHPDFFVQLRPST